MVEDLRRLGGEAGVIAGVALGWLLLGILVVWPSAGLSFGAEFNPNRILPWVHKHEAMFWAVNILGGLLAAAIDSRTTPRPAQGSVHCSASSAHSGLGPRPCCGSTGWDR